ncbi:MAG: hypothetical protein OXC08_01040 [Thiotrichales bacterium]|nr:hypothetical protein [Thiotrichales bacterium]
MTAKHYDIVILGAGLGGLGMASRIRAAGRTDFVIFEQAESARRHLGRVREACKARTARLDPADFEATA